MTTPEPAAATQPATATPPAPAATAPADAPAAAASEVPAAPGAADAGPAPAAEPAADAPATGKSTNITAGQGGVMTDEVGVVTGELTLRTELSGDQVTVRVQYQDADEWYAVTGATATLKDPADLDAVHSVAVGILNRPEG
jgi:hypothetical protein